MLRNKFHKGLAMDVASGQIDQTESESVVSDGSAFSFGVGDEYLIKSRDNIAGIAPELFQLRELDVRYDPETAALWSYIRPTGRPSFTEPMLRDFHKWQQLIDESFAEDAVPLRYLVLGSHAPGVFCFGGDLELFQQLISDGNRQGLVDYGYSCVEILHSNYLSLNRSILTIGLVEGAALGGGFEALLSFDRIIAESSATFGLPETLFGLFPGMGAHAFLTRKIGAAMADRLISSTRTYSAQEMYDLGVVHMVVPDGSGREACADYIRKSERRHAGLVKSRQALRTASPVTLDELKQIVDIWADCALLLSKGDLKVMGRLTKAQEKKVIEPA